VATMTSNPGLQATIDELWNFNDPAASERRFAAASDAEEDALLRAAFDTQRARALGLQHRFDEARALLDTVPVATVELSVRVELERGRIENTSGRAAEARGHFDRAFREADAAGLENLAVDALHMIAIVAAPGEREELTERAIRLASAASDPRARRWLASLYNNSGWDRFDRDDLPGALERFELALAERERMGQPRETAVARWSVGRVLRAMGRVTDAYAIQQALLGSNARAGMPDPYVNEELGECLLAMGRAAEAREHFAIALPFLENDGFTAQAEPERIARIRGLLGV
jgi:tetratricopeptide (TPR) repeat protein